MANDVADEAELAIPTLGVLVGSAKSRLGGGRDREDV